MRRGFTLEYLNFRTPDPSNCWKLMMKQKMIGFVVESPLANSQIRSAVLHSLNHLLEGFALVFPQFPVLLCRLHFQLVFSFGFGRLEWTSQDCQLGVLNFLKRQKGYIEESQCRFPVPWAFVDD